MDNIYKLECRLFDGQRKILWIENPEDAVAVFMDIIQEEPIVKEAILYKCNRDYNGEVSPKGGNPIRIYLCVEEV